VTAATPSPPGGFGPRDVVAGFDRLAKLPPFF